MGGIGVSAATADVITRTLNAMGGTIESNSASMWCSARCYAYNAWYASGGYAYLNYSNFCNALRVWPCVLLERNLES